MDNGLGFLIVVICITAHSIVINLHVDQVEDKLDEPRHVTLTICHQYQEFNASKIIDCKPYEGN